MIVDYLEYLGKRIKLVVSFQGLDKIIYYDGIVIEYNAENRLLKIKDRFDKIVLLDTETIKQVVIV